MCFLTGMVNNIIVCDNNKQNIFANKVIFFKKKQLIVQENKTWEWNWFSGFRHCKLRSLILFTQIKKAAAAMQLQIYNIDLFALCYCNVMNILK